MIDELGRLFSNLSRIVPEGIVCFFPSYAYEEQVLTRWEATKELDRIQSKKRIFRETRTGGQSERILQHYSECIKESGGAILCSVVGGKMSEGINFSDGLARCVIMVGMPYPNAKDPELCEKMVYLDKTLGSPSGRNFYENICMKAVNQSIGRSIRHRGDYSSILLVDSRYQQPHVSSRLPQWISECVEMPPKFGQVVSSVAKFFRQKKNLLEC